MGYKNIKKVGLCIVAFEGTEHLYNIISELRCVVDYVSIGYQMVSYHGTPIEQTDYDEIMTLYAETGLVDNVLDIVTNPDDLPRVQETEKRNRLIQDAEEHGCSHCIVIDSDEYYNASSFRNALDKIDENDYEMTYCQYINYYHDYMHYLVYPFKQGMYVPFVSRTKYRHSFDCTDFPLPSDPTRRFVLPYDGERTEMRNGKCVKVKNYTAQYHIFAWEDVKMHHLSWIRKDIRKKLYNWSSKQLIREYDIVTERAISKYEQFDENSEEGVATLLFNSKDNQLKYKKLPKRYIYPKVDIRTRCPERRTSRRILVLNMSSNNSDVDLFNRLEETGRLTWARDILLGKYPNISYWKVVDGTADVVDAKTLTVYVRNMEGKSDLQQLLYRFMKALDLLRSHGVSFDWVIRTNTSTWINIAMLDVFLSQVTDTTVSYTSNLYCAYWSMFHLYMSGNAMVMSNDTLLMMKQQCEKANLYAVEDVMDDVLMSSIIYTRCKPMGIDERQKMKALGCVHHRCSWSGTDMSDIDFSSPFHQIKTFDDQPHSVRVVDDIEKMQAVDKAYRRLETDTDELVGRMLDRNNKVYMIPYPKQQFARLDALNRKDIQFRMPMDLDDAFDMGRQLQVKYYAKNK